MSIRNIIMYRDVGFDLTHKHCIDFENEAQRDAYFDGLTEKRVFENCNYNKADNMLNLECGWTEALTYGYCSFLYDDKKIFCFVTGCRVVNDRVTAFELKTDVWQTFLFGFRISEGMVIREHVDRWDRDGKVLWRRASTEDTVSVYDRCFSSELAVAPLATDKGYGLHMGAVFISYLGKNDDKGYHRIMLPVLTAKPLTVGLVDVISIQTFVKIGVATYGFVSIDQILSGRFEFDDTLAPDSIISISYEPISSVRLQQGTTVQFTINEFFGFSTATVTFETTTASIFDNWEHKTCKKGLFEYIYFKEHTSGLDELLNNERKTIYVIPMDTDFTKPVKPKDGDLYSSEHEPEMYKNPYYIRTIEDSDGSLISEIPDLCWWDDRTMWFFELNDNNETSCMYVITNHVSDASGTYQIPPKMFSAACALGLAYKVPCINLDVPSDAWKSYVLSSRNTDREMLQSTINQQAVTSAIGAITGMAGISGMAGSGKTGGIGFNPYQALVGGAVGAVMSGASYLANSHFGWEQQEIKEKAIRNQPNNLLKSATGDGIMRAAPILHSYNEQRCTNDVFGQAAQRYHKFGYLVNMFAKPNIRTRKFFNFVQTSQIRIEGALNQAVKDGIADILNNGVTIWHGEFITKDKNGKFVMDYSKENIERSLL